MGLAWLLLLEVCKFVGRKHRRLIYVRAVGPLLVRTHPCAAAVRVEPACIPVARTSPVVCAQSVDLCLMAPLQVQLHTTPKHPFMCMVQVTIISIAVMNIGKYYKAPYNIGIVGKVHTCWLRAERGSDCVCLASVA
jgi:hypothetical protein